VPGLLEGSAKVVFRKDYECKEVKCLSKVDAFREFLVAARTKA
jgi:predicted hydrocarbon binding protein